MRKFLKWTLIVLVSLAIILVIAFKIMQSNTKKYSPEAEIEYAVGDLEVEVFYNRPYKKDREIFGELVPYGEVWRTGANEATTFTINKDVMINGQKLDAGKYTLWTIPNEESWMVIFNSKQYDWGVGWDEKASRKAEFDVLKAEVPVKKIYPSVEQFTIQIKGKDTLTLDLIWDETKVSLPFYNL